MSVTLRPAANAAVYAQRDIATRQGLSAAIQYDNRKDTLYGNVRCGAAATVAAAVLSGESAVQRLLSGLEAPSRGVGRREAVIAAARGEMAQQRRLSTETVQRLQDLLYEIGNTDGVPGTTSTEQDGHIRLAGLPTRPLTDATPPPPLSENISSGSSSGAQTSANGAAVSAGPPESPAADWRARLDRILQPGEAVPLMLDTGNPNMGHIVLVGRQRDGSLYAVDSDQARGMLYGTNPAHRDALDALLTRATGVWGSQVVRVGG